MLRAKDDFMEAIAVYIKEYNNMHNKVISFSPCFSFEFKQSKIVVSKKNEFNIFNYFKSNIVNVTAIVGDNGSGKTSILNVMSDVFAYKHSTNGNFILFYDNVDRVYVLGKNEIEIICEGNDIEIKHVEDDFVCYGGQNIGNIFPVGMCFISNVFNPSAYYYPYHDSKPGDGYFNYEIAKLIKDAAMKDEPSLSNIVYPYICEETKREIKFIKTHGNIAGFDIRNCIIRNISDNIQRDFEDKIKTVKKNFFVKTESIFNKDWIEVVANKEFYFWAKFVLNSVCAFVSIYQSEDKDKLLKQFERWLFKYWEVIYSNRNSSNYQDVLVDVMKSFFNRYNNFSLNIHEHLTAVMKLLHDNFKFIDGVYRAEHEKQVQVVFDIYEHYIALSNKGINGLDFSWDMSSGERGMLSLFARLNALSDNMLFDYDNVLICIDEADVLFHPKWQQEFVYKLQNILTKIYDGKNIQIIMTSHSPIFLSDIPRKHVVLLQETEELNETFAANIFELYNNTFFLKEHNNIGIMGDYSNHVIKYVLNIIAIKEACIKIADLGLKNNDLSAKKQIGHLIKDLLHSIDNCRKLFADNSITSKVNTLVDFIYEYQDRPDGFCIESKIDYVENHVDKLLKVAVNDIVPLIGEEFLRKRLREKINDFILYKIDNKNRDLQQLIAKYDNLSESEKIAFLKYIGR